MISRGVLPKGDSGFRVMIDMECRFPTKPNRFADDVRCWPLSGKHLLLLSFSVFDPEADSTALI
jgi:hypothetical protein